MAITFLELSKELSSLAGYLEGREHGNIMAQLASDAIALNKKRVVETGKNAEGQSFKPYSTKPMLTGSKNFIKQTAAQSLLSTKEKRRNLSWKTINGHKLFELPGGYKQFRELNSRQTKFVDFTMSGRMMGDIQTASDQAELNSGVAVIKPLKTEEKKKLAGNTEKRGDILALSKSEEAKLGEKYSAWVEGGLRKFKLI